MPFCPAIKISDTLKERKRSLAEVTTDAKWDKVGLTLQVSLGRHFF